MFQYWNVQQLCLANCCSECHSCFWTIWFWIHWKRQSWLGKWNVKSFSMTRNMEQCEVRPTDLKVVIDSVSLDYWSITVQKVSQRCKRYILNVKPIVSLIDKRTKLWRCKSCIHFGSNFGFNIFAWHLWLILLIYINNILTGLFIPDIYQKKITHKKSVNRSFFSYFSTGQLHQYQYFVSFICQI